jgi:predicted metal-binding membrane protein
LFAAEWREGQAGALAMGLRHGIHCVGCCWLLMGLLFVAGVMNLLWIAAIAGFVLVEKVMPGGRIVGRVAGAALVVWGLLTLAGRV